MSSRSSTRKKEEQASKGKKKDVEIVSDDSEGTAGSEDEPEIVSLSGEDENSDEVVAPKKSRSNSCSFNKSAFSMPDDISKLMNRVLCTACGKQLNPMNQGAVRKHPWLKVVSCKKCYKFLKSGPFTRDSEGTDEQCRWCGDGGRLYGCDYCHNCFCRSCIKRNLGRTEAADMENQDAKSKWKCYMCKPKKIRTLVENCTKILDYIKKEEDKEKAREERAQQREKDKAQAAKQKREEKRASLPNGKPIVIDDKKDRRTSLPFPVPKSKLVLDDKKDRPQPKTVFPSPKPIAPKPAPDCIVIDESPDRSNVFKHATFKGHVPIYNSRPGDGVQKINKAENGVTQVVVGPKAKVPISTPYKDSAKLDGLPTLRPALFGALTTNQFPASNGSLSNPTLSSVLSSSSRAPLPATMLSKKGITQQPKLNDIHALKEQVLPFNVETLTDKLTTVAQAFNLMLSSVKTDLAIAKLSSTNLFQSRTSASYSVVSGVETFFNNIRDIFNVQIVMNSPMANDSSNPINIDDDTDVKTDIKTEVKTEVKTEKDTSNDNTSSTSDNTKDSKLDIKKEISENVKEEVKDENKSSELKQEESSVEDDGPVEMDVDENAEQDKAMDISDSDEEQTDKQSERADKDAKRSDKKEKDKVDKKSSDKDTKKSTDKDKKSTEKSDKKSSEKVEDDKKEGKHSSPKKSKSGSDKDNDKEVKSKTSKQSNKSESEDELEGSESDMNVNSTAADLDLLKELADEINDSKDKDGIDEVFITPRASRRDKTQTKSKDDTGDDGETSESSGRRSSRNRSSNKDQGKGEQDDQEKSNSKSKSESTKRESRNKSKDADTKDVKKESSKTKMKAESTDKDESSAEEVSESQEDKEESTRKSSRSKSKGSDEKDQKSEKSERSRSKDKKETKSKEESLSEDADEDVESKSDKTDKAKRGSGSKSSSADKKDSKKETGKSKGKEESKAGKDDSKAGKDDSKAGKEYNKAGKEESKPGKEESKTGKEDNKVSPKKESEEEKEEEVSSDSDSSVASQEFGKRKRKRNTRAKEEEEESKDKKASKSKSDKKEKEKGDKKEKEKSDRKQKEKGDRKEKEKGDKKEKEKGDKKEKETSSKSERSSRSKSEKSEEKEEHSDSSNYDSDLEKEIKQLSKDTKLKTRATRAGAAKVSEKESEKESNTKTGKKKSAKSDQDEDSKEGKEKSTDDYEDLSSDEEEEKDEDEEEEEVNGEGGEDEEEEEEDVDEDDLSPSQLRKLRAAQKEEKESDYEDMDASDESEDPEVSFPKLETPKKGKGKGKNTKEEESEDSDFITPKKKKRKLKSDLLDAKLSDSDSDLEPKKKKGRGRKRKKKEEEEDEEPDPEDEVYSDDGKKKKGKRKRIKKVESSSEEEKEKGEEGDEYGSEEDGMEDTPGGAHKRRKIRKVMANKKLKDSTKEARKAEDERRKRIEERQKEFNAFVEVEGGESEDEVAEGTEREKTDEGDDSIAKILGTAKKVPVTTRCVLDMDKESKDVLIEIDKTLVRKLKPHQVEAVRFMFNCLVESTERMKKEDGAGCILAHCMGLGKTLSVITFLHTMLSNVKLTKMTKCLVVCPLNTVLNWVNELEIWLEDVPYEVDVYEMSKVKQNFERAQMLREWHEGNAGIMILGYDMYRNLVQGSHCKNKKQKATFYECLADPGPDIVVCDEGHILKNDATSLSKAMMKIKTKRRVVLTGTPLQNNLGEYHCMVNFVKENLLGTRKEFGNRFVNPITNGQCTDSSASDVKLMKRRAHILHEMLAGCVQRKDYSALTKFLPPKFEFVVAVRMGKLQCNIYDRYLKEAGVVQNEEVQGKGGRLFRDYQALMRIWTHPWVLKLDEIRQENKRTYDSEDSFIDDTESEGEDSFISASTTSESDEDYGSKKKKSKGKGKGKKKKGSGSSSDDDVKIVNEDEVVKKWTSKRRGNEEGAGSSWMQDMGYSTGPKEVSNEWWAEYVKEEDEFKIELSGKLTLLFEILKMCEDIGDKVLVFSQSLLSLDIIEDFLRHIDEANQKPAEGEEGEENKETDGTKDETKDEVKATTNGDAAEEEKEGGKKKDKKEDEEKKNKYADYGKSWTLGGDYFRMDGSTNSQQRKASQDSFNDPENYRARLFLISTKAGSLGINLVAANRVIIFDASWNPSHDIQSIFRVYRFGQVKPVYVYRFLAQGTMEEKIYERQVTKQSLSQRVVDEHQIERHFNSNDLQELYKFQPDRLDDPDRKERPLPMLPKDHMLAELMGSQKDWIVTFHEHDSLLENIVEQELSEEEKKAAWEDYENDKKGLNTALPYNNMMMMNSAQRMNSALEFQNLVLQGQANLGQEAVLQIVQDLKARFPTLPPEVFSQRVQAVLRQVLTQRIMQQSDYQRRQVQQMDMQKMAELNRLNQIKQQIQQQQALVNNQQRGLGLQSNFGAASNSLLGVQALPSSGYYPSVLNQNRAGAMGSGQPPQAHSGSATSTPSLAMALQKSKEKKK